MKWYMTVGVPGGEYAVKADDIAYSIMLLEDATQIIRATSDPFLTYRVRPCPPDLVEWIEAGISAGIKVPGGWILIVLSDRNAAEMATFIPVAGAAGLTILENPDEPS